MQLSAHFAQSEFEMDGPLPEECLPVVRQFCQEVLEPIREQFGPFIFTSARRTDEANAEAHGQPNSEHLYTADQCAVDGYVPDVPARMIFDWARYNAHLPFHQLILEHGSNGFTVLHISMNRLLPGVRSVLEGATHNAGKYTPADHVAFNA
jgi:hypothetical protein